MPEPEWPTFTVPEGSDIPLEEKPSSDAGQPPAPAPTGTAAAPSAGATPPVPAGAPPEEMFPKHRYDELNTRNQQLQTQLQELTRLLHAVVPLAKGPGAPPAPAAPPDPVRDRVVGQIQEYMPWLTDAEKLAAMKDRIEAALTRIDEIAQDRELATKTEQAEWDGYAKQTLKAVHAAIAPFYLPAGKTVADLPPFKVQTITDLFVRWIGDDNQRALRYNAHDPGLQQEFVKFFEDEMVHPFKRDAAAALAARARKVGALPVGGQTSSTLGTPPPKPKDDDDEDAVYKRAWAVQQDLAKNG